MRPCRALVALAASAVCPGVLARVASGAAPERSARAGCRSTSNHGGRPIGSAFRHWAVVYRRP